MAKGFHFRDLVQRTTAITAFVAFLFNQQVAYALPQGGQVVAGQAVIDADQAASVNINQSSNRVVLNWDSFDIGNGETVTFSQPSSTAIALNRINSGNATQILGMLNANGQVWLMNPNGVVFGSNAVVDVGGLLATTSNISDSDFMAGHHNFTSGGNSLAGIFNAGRIHIKDGGVAALVGNNVTNHGLIEAHLGKVQLASGDAFAFDLAGDGLINLEASSAVQHQLVSNSGVIVADGGQVLLTAAAAESAVNSLINMDGLIQANSVGDQSGEITLFAEGSNAVISNIAAVKGQKQGSSTVLVSGVLDASGRDGGERGGEITVTGDNVALLNGTVIDASGSDGARGTTAGLAVSAHRDGSAGGDIRIGGDYLGGGITPTAKNIYVASGVLVLNDAMNSGDAGRSIFWSDATTWFYGNVYARALGGKQADSATWQATSGGNAGDGGFVETSGHGHLNVGGYVDLTSSNGHRGTWFLDPTNITIYGNTTSVFNNAGLVGHWALDDGSGTNANDLTANNNDGTLTNGPTWSSSAAPTPQANPFSLVLDGGDDFVNIGDNNTASFTSGGMSVSTWVNSSAALAGQEVFSKYDAGGNEYAMAFAAGNLYFFVRDNANGGYIGRRTSVGFSTSQWYHLTATYDGGTTASSVKIYVDGVQLDTTDFTGGGGFVSMKNTNGSLRIADAPNWGGANWQGSMDDVRLYNNALSANDAGELTGTRFTVTGIETMSATADVSMQASNNVTFDLGGDTLDLVSGRNLTVTAGNDILTASAGTVNTAGTGSILLSAGNDINLTHDLDLNATGSGSVTLRANNSILYSGSGDITTAGGAIILNSDHDASGAGAISLGSGTILTSTGGNITLGGGADPTTTAALGTASNVHGITMNNAQLQAGGGSISVRGQGAALATNFNAGIWQYGGSDIVTSGAGTITLTGQGGGAGASGINDGLYLSDAGTTIAAGSGGITLNGTGGVGSGGFHTGIVVYNDVYVSTTGTGAVNVTGVGGTGAAGSNNGAWIVGSLGLYSVDGNITVNGTGGTGASGTNNGVWNSTGNIISTGLGNIAVTGTGGAGVSGGSHGVYGAGIIRATTGTTTITGAGVSGHGVGYDIAVGNVGNGSTTGNTTYNADLLSMGTLTTTGNIYFRPNSQSGTIGVSGAAGTLQITQAILDGLSANTVVIGRSDGTGLMRLGATNISAENYHLSLLNGSGNIQFDGNLTMAANKNIGTATASGSVVIGAATGITTSGTGDITFDDPLSLSANLTLTSADTITFGGTVNGGFDLTASAGTFSFASAWGGSTPLDDVSLTSVNSLSLPSISAGSIFARSTGAASDLTLAGGVVLAASKAGTTATLVAGRNFINGSGSGALSTPAGRWLVYSTNPASDTIGSLSNNFRRFTCAYGGSCPSLGSGNGLLYSYTPTLTTTPNSIAAISYGDAVPSLAGYAYSLSGYLGSDSGSDNVTGSLTGTTTYTQGSNIGSYNVNYGSGSLASTMGYGFSYASNATAITVNPRSLTIAADAKSKTYGAVDPALTYQLTGGSLYGADFFSGALSRAVGETVAGGPYAISQNTLTAGSNYTIGYTGANLTINPALLTVTADAKSKTYGAADPGLSYGYTGLVNGDVTATFSGSLTRAAGETVAGGPYSITQGTLAASGNYTIGTFNAGAFTINPALLVVTADNKSKTVGTADPMLTYLYTGLVNGDLAATFAGALVRVAGESVAGGPYGITRGTLAASGNYTIGTFNGGSFSIIPNSSNPPGGGSVADSVALNTEVLEMTTYETSETTKSLTIFVCRRPNDPKSCKAL